MRARLASLVLLPLLSLVGLPGQNPDTVYCFCGAGDPYDQVARGWALGQLGLLDPATGEPYRAAANGDIKNAAGVVVGSEIRNAAGNRIGWRNAAGTREAYDVTAGATVNQAWQRVANNGDFHIIKHGFYDEQDGVDGPTAGDALGGGIQLDNGGAHDGFRDAAVAGPGTGAGYGAAYGLAARAGANISVHLCSCFADNDPDGLGQQTSVTTSFRGVPGAGNVNGPAGVSTINFSLSYMGNAANLNRVIDCMRDEAKRRKFIRRDAANNEIGDASSWLQSLPFADQYSTAKAEVERCLKKLKLAAGSVKPILAYTKPNPADACGGGDQCHDYYPCALAIGPAGGPAAYADGDMQAHLSIPAGAVASRRLLKPAIRELPAGIAPNLAPASATVDFRYPGEPTFLAQAARLTLGVAGLPAGAVVEVFRQDGSGGWVWENTNRVHDATAGTIAVDVTEIGAYVACVPKGVVYDVTAPSPTQTDSVSASLRCAGLGSSNHTFEQWWYYRLPGDTRELPFRNDGRFTMQKGGPHIDMNWSDVDGKGFAAQMDFDVVPNGSNSALVWCDLTITNFGSLPLTIDLFHYLDFDVNATAAGNLVRGDGTHHFATNSLRQVYLDAVADGPTHSDIGPFSSTELGLADTSVLPAGVLAGNLPPLGPGDYSGAFQWAGNVIPAGESRVFRVVIAACMAIPYGFGAAGTAGVPLIESGGAARQDVLVPTSVQFLLSGGRPLSGALLLFGIVPASLNLAGLQVWVDPSLSVTLFVPTDPAGGAAAAFTLPPTPDLRGLRLYGEWLVLDPLGVGGIASHTRGLELRLDRW